MTELEIRERITLTSPDQVNTEHYQLLPEAEEERFNALVEDIRKKGIENPLIIDVDYNVIDGNTRVHVWRKIISEGGEIPPVPALIGTDLDTELEKRTEARRRNALQRPLNFAQRKKIAAEQLEEVTYTEKDGTVVSWSNQRIADTVGIGKTTVRELREAMENRKDDPLPVADITVNARGRRERVEVTKGKGKKGLEARRRDAVENGNSNKTYTPDEVQDLVNTAVEVTTNPVVHTSESEDKPGETPAIKKLQDAGIEIPPYPSGKTPAEKVKEAVERLQEVVQSLEVSPEDAARSVESTPIEAVASVPFYHELIEWLTRFNNELASIARFNEERKEIKAL